jgi:hypothetical protein
MHDCHEVQRNVYQNINYNQQYPVYAFPFSVDSFHIPIVVSFPHFFMADQKYQDAVYGMHPDPVEHRTEIGIEPVSITSPSSVI